ncbi:MAG: hypothetical protein IJ872_03940 [Eubacterium sp.]|nr:hypothetical protein [Eubacterium sp.]
MKFWNAIDAIKWICIIIVLFGILFAMDLANIPSRFIDGFNHINENIFSTAVNAFVVIILYIISYYAIEKHQKDKTDEAEKREQIKEGNTKEVAELLICNTYTQCMKTIESVQDDRRFKNYIIPKVGYGGTVRDEKKLEEYINFPFQNFEQIMDLAKAGYVTREELDEYLNIRSDFKNTIKSKIEYHDDSEDTEVKKLFNTIVNQEIDKLYEKLREHICQKNS